MDVYLKQTSDSDMGVSTLWHKICTYIGQSMHGIGLKDEEEQFTISEWPRLPGSLHPVMDVARIGAIP